MNPADVIFNGIRNTTSEVDLDSRVTLLERKVTYLMAELAEIKRQQQETGQD